MHNPKVGDIWQEKLNGNTYRYLLVEECQVVNHFDLLDLDLNLKMPDVHVNPKSIDWKRLG